MDDTFTIELPATVSDSDIEVLEQELKHISGIMDAGSLGSRSIDLVMLGMWVQTVGGGLGVVVTAVSLIEKIVVMIRGKGIKGAKITLANGTVISVDEISSAELTKLIQAVNQPASQKPG